MPRPDKSTADGQRWVYRLEGHRKCWFQAAEGVAVKNRVHHPAGKQRVSAREENGAARRKRKPVVDARAELLRAAPGETVQPTPPGPELKVVDAAPVPGTAAVTLVAPATVVAEPAPDQLTPDHTTPRQVGVATLLAAAPSDDDAAASRPAPPVVAPAAETGDDGRGWMETSLGVLLMALGIVFLLGSSRTLPAAVLVGRLLDPKTAWRRIAGHSPARAEVDQNA
ncbi:MAG: hypothetical protein HY852_27295 [Bradyrhizobium sp.]|uniref:hypothetical protein n=1 Tax=Bradyrhizobium sp. TaxID=376 RepID=UPI0025BEEBAC|nr:hypothetical protein [Bradyrhizobium sp.]MBI5265517.1 hypothetical protein [Bradyrhizobium sp.]